jgi:hypothetical protein
MTLHQLYINKVEAGIPVMGLINAIVFGIDLADKFFKIGEKVAGLFKVRNDTNTTQNGSITINVFNKSNPSSPEVSISQNLIMPPKAQQTYQLPSIQPSSSGEKIIQIATGLNSLSTTFRYGLFCCDSRGNRRCPVPYSNLNVGTECLCNGQGVGNVCE